MVIRKINVNDIDIILEQILEESTKVKILQAEFEDVNTNLDKNQKDFVSGSISKEIYKEIKTNFEKQKKILEDKISELKNNILTISNSLYNIMNDSKI